MFGKGEEMTHRTRRRVGTVVLAPAAALITWALIRLSGIDLVVSSGDGTVSAADVLSAALVGALGGWVVVRLLERYSGRPRASWSFVGSTALAVSVIGPAWLADGASSVALIALHVVTAVVVISGFVSTLPVHRSAGGTPRARPLAGNDPAR
jgi:ABC-type Co2+ transport system permease subunit